MPTIQNQRTHQKKTLVIRCFCDICLRIVHVLEDSMHVLHRIHAWSNNASTQIPHVKPWCLYGRVAAQFGTSKTTVLRNNQHTVIEI
jgi:hypothetical protein